MTDCSCPLAGYCPRHQITKTQHWWELCQHRDDYRALWDAGRGPAQDRSNNKRDTSKLPKVDVEAYRKHWAKLHTKEDATPEWFETWCRHIPNISCNCQGDFQAILKQCPPRYDDWFPWTVEVHNAVNRKRRVAELTVDEARKIWFPG